MNNKHEILIKKTLVVFIVLFLFIPLLRLLLHHESDEDLNGNYVKANYPILTYESLFDLSYQGTFETYVNENIGFRNSAIPIYNQFFFSFFNEAKANGVIVGKDNYLFELNYIKAFNGQDFVGEDKIKQWVRKTKFIQEKLLTKNIYLIIILAPGKGSFYSEFIPNSYLVERPSETNYEALRRNFKLEKISFLDFKDWFKSIKTNSIAPLFTKTGIHWSKYGEVLAADSILKYIDNLTVQEMPKLTVNKLEWSKIPRDTDNDCEKSMNLLFPIENHQYAYPIFNFERDSNYNYPKVLTIADSYFWGMFNFNLSNFGFNKGQFWYYNKQIFPDSYNKEKNVDDINVIEEVEKNNFIIIMSTDANLYDFSFGFIDLLYSEYNK